MGMCGIDLLINHQQARTLVPKKESTRYQQLSGRQLLTLEPKRDLGPAVRRAERASKQRRALSHMKSDDDRQHDR